MDHDSTMTSDILRMIIASAMADGKHQVSSIELERLLNAIARAQSGVPTGANWPMQ